MAKRLLNVEYSKVETRINVADLEDLSEVRRAIKAELAITLSQFDAPQLQLYDQNHQKIEDLEDIPDDYYVKKKNGGLYLVVRTSPPPSRKSSRNDLSVADFTSFITAEEDIGDREERERRDDHNKAKPDLENLEVALTQAMEALESSQADPANLEAAMKKAKAVLTHSFDDLKKREAELKYANSEERLKKKKEKG